jgi:hypothetical protein
MNLLAVSVLLLLPVVPPLLASSPARLADAPVDSVLLTDSGSDEPLPVRSEATEPAEPGLTAPLHVSVPAKGCSKLLGIVNPLVQVPTNTPIRRLEAYWNGTRLPMLDPRGTEWTDEAHSWGSPYPFFQPLCSLAGLPAGEGFLELRGYDAEYGLIARAIVPDLTISLPPAPVATERIASLPHPRLWLTPERLVRARARDAATDPFAARFEAAIDRFLEALDQFPDPESEVFQELVWNPESYVPALAAEFRIEQERNPLRAERCAAAAKRLALFIANAYATGARGFGRDTGYDIRLGLPQMMLAYDWMWERFTPEERHLLAQVSTDWCAWYRDTPGYAESHPIENYWSSWLQALTLTSIVAAGEHPAAAPLLPIIRAKLQTEVPIASQRACGGDWAEGWNYGPLAIQELVLVRESWKEVGEDWSVPFEFVDRTARSLTYQMSPGFSELRSYGGYSGSVPHKTSPALLAVLSSLTEDGALAARLFDGCNALPENDFQDTTEGFTVFEMLFGEAGSMAEVSALPLSYFNAGTGRFFSRSDLAGRGGTFASAECTSYAYDHYGYSNGDARLYDGEECLLCPAAYRGGDFRGEDLTPAFSTCQADDRIQEIALARNNQVLFAEEHGLFSSAGMRYESSYASNRFDESIFDPTNPFDYLIREVVHLRPGTLVVRDLHRRPHPETSLVASWHLGSSEPTTALPGGGFVTGPLHWWSWSNPGSTFTFEPDLDEGGARIGTLARQSFPSSTVPSEALTVFSIDRTGASWANGVLTFDDGTTVTFPGGRVRVSPKGQDLFERRLVVPGQAHAAGAEGAYFRSALWLANPSAERLPFRLRYVPAAGFTSGGAVEEASVELPAEGTLSWQDVLAELFGATADTTGVVIVESRAGDPLPVVSARTYNDGAAGTFGQFIPAAPIEAGRRSIRLEGLAGGAASRTNVGVVNLGEGPTTATIALFLDSGAPIGHPVALTIPPLSAVQVNRIDETAGAGPLTGFRALVTSGSEVFAYASKLDNRTSDPIFVPGALPARAVQWIDGVASTSGAGGTFFRSSLTLANRTAVPASVTIAYTRRGASAPSDSKTVQLAAGEARSYEDAVVELFGGAAAGSAGAFSLTSTPAVVAWARTYNDGGSAGTFGQFIPAFGPEDLFLASGAFLTGLSDDESVRTNVGLVNVSERPLDALLRTRTNDGTLVGEKNIAVPARTSLFLYRFLNDLGVGSLSQVRLEIVPSRAGALYSWASIVDNRSTDQTFVRPVAAP